MENKKDMIIKKLYFSTFIVVIDSCFSQKQQVEAFANSCFRTRSPRLKAGFQFYDLDQQGLFVL